MISISDGGVNKRVVNMDDKSDQMNKVLQKTIEAIEESKVEIFKISESARDENGKIKKELEEIQIKVKTIINEVDRIENQERSSRNILLVVSKNFSKYTEENIKKAYESANQLQIKLALKRQEEKDIIERRTDLEIRLRNSADVLKRSENLISKVGIAFDFLNNDLEEITEKLEDINLRTILGRRIIQVQEEERQRIAMDIHDGPAQSLTNAIIKTEVCQKLMDLDIDSAKIEIIDLKKILRMSIRDIRAIIYNLRPMALDDIGFIPTLKRYTSNFQNNTNICVDLIILSEIEIKDSTKNVALFRIVQEALNNIQKHSKATNVKIKVEVTEKNIYLLIEDNGIGFEMDNLTDLVKHDSGFGLLNMRERVELLEGKLEIKSSKESGVKIIISLANKA